MTNHTVRPPAPVPRTPHRAFSAATITSPRPPSSPPPASAPAPPGTAPSPPAFRDPPRQSPPWSLTSTRTAAPSRRTTTANVPPARADVYDSLGSVLGEFSGPLSHYGVEAVYQPDGQPQEIDLGQSTSALWSRAVYSYDPASQRLTEAETQHQHTVNGVNVWATDADTSYAYDPSGNVLSADDPVTSDNQCFAYDYLARLTVAWSQASACLIRSATTGGRSAGDTAEAIRVGEMSVPDHGCPAATLSARPGFGGPGRRVQGAPDPG